MCRRTAVLLFLGMMFFSLCRCEAQSVRQGEITAANMSRKRFEKEADKQGRSDFFSTPYERPGTQVRITFEGQDADVTLMTNREYGLQRLLEDMQALAQHIDCPRADLLTVEGSKTVTVDVELNKYIVRQPRRTDFDLDLGALAAALKNVPLPAPVVIGIDTTDSERVTLQTDGTTRSLEGITFYGLNEIPADAHLHFVFTPAPYAAPAGLLLLALLAAPPFLAWRAGRRRPAVPQAEPAAPSIPLSPEEVQRRYDRRGPLWIAQLLPLLAGIPLLIGRSVNVSRLALSWQMLLPGGMKFLMAWGGLSVLAVFCITWRNRRAQAKLSSDAKTVKPDGSPVTPFIPLWLLLPLFLTVPIPPLMLMLPAYNAHDLLIRRILLFGLIGLSLIVEIVMLAFWRRKQKRAGITEREELKAGVWYEMVQEMAARAGIAVRHVYLITSAMPNAYASVSRSVSLTTGLLAHLEPEEVRAVVAHEIGHIKARHPQRTFISGIVLFVLVVVGWEWLRFTLAARFPNSAGLVFNLPFLFLVVSNLLMALLLGPLRRRREREADAYAVQWIGDPELVIRALTKVNQGIGNPNRLKRSDEALSSHPSLQNRIDAIRRIS